MITSKHLCPICTDPTQRVLWQRTLSFRDQRRLAAWYAQPCTACGLVLGVHQIYLHPHAASSYGTHCVGFCQPEGGEDA